jgi:SPP1 family predicted phage head-tail adaptor
MGGQVESWSNVGTVACRISPLDLMSGYEADQGGAVTTVAQRVITLPHHTDVTSTDRLLSGGNTYEIKNIRAERSYELSRRVNAVEVG